MRSRARQCGFCRPAVVRPLVVRASWHLHPGAPASPVTRSLEPASEPASGHLHPANHQVNHQVSGTCIGASGTLSTCILGIVSNAMLTWTGIAFAFATLAALGNSADRLLLRTSKRRLYDWMTRAWYKLDHSPIADLPALVASVALRPLLHTNRKNQWPLRLGIMFGASVLLTGSAALVGRLVRRRVFPWFDSIALPLDSSAARVITTEARWLFERWWQYLPALFINFAFDAATVLTTLILLDRVRTAASAFRRLATLGLSLCLAVSFALGSLTAMNLVVNSSTDLAQSARWSAEILLAVLTWNTQRRYAPGFDDAFYGMSTLIPLGAYLGALVLAIIGKAILSCARAVGLYWLELATEPLPGEIDSKFLPFTLLGLLLGAAGALAKLVVDLAKLTNH